MSTQDRDASACLAEALAVTENMLAAAEVGDWETVQALVPRRAELMREVEVAGPIPRGPLEEMADLSARLAALAAEHRDELGARTRHLRRGNRAARAYDLAAR